LKNVITIVTLATVLSACATFSPATPPAAGTNSAATEATSAQNIPNHGNADASPADGANAEAGLPTVNLGSELVYKLLSTEVAQQRGEWQAAYVTLLGIAQQTRDPRLARRAMEIALSAKHVGEALTAIRLWRELAPQSDEANQYYLGFAVLGENLNEAKAIFVQRLNAAPASGRSLIMFQMQQALSRAKDKAAAFALMEEVLMPYQATLEAHLVLAQSAFVKGDLARANREARAAQAIKPDSDLAALTQAQVAPDVKTAEKILADFLYVYPKSREVRIAYGRMLIDHKQYHLARSEFEILLTSQPKDLTTLYTLGVITMQDKDIKAAEKYFISFLDALESNPNEERDPSQVLNILAEIAEERGDTDAAIKWLDKIESTASRNSLYLNAQLKRVQLVAKHGDFTTAHKMLKEVHADTPEDQSQIILTDAQILREANQPKQAFAVLEAGVKRFPANADILYDYAMAAEKIDRLNLMETSLRQVMVLAPNNHHAYNALGYSLAERNIRLSEALMLIEKALKMAPDDPFILDSMGWVQYRMGRLPEAQQMLRRAYELRPDAEIAVHLGEVLWRQGQKDDAQKFWREAKMKDPRNDVLKSTLTRLKVVGL
jgi:tetratricopeptide (TPR) repeat protein